MPPAARSGMAIQFPVDKLTLINSALSQTGDLLVNVVDDGSDEWNVCSPAYERGLAYALEQGSYGFTTKVAALAASPTAPADDSYDTAYNLPPDLLHLIWVKVADRPVLYDILNSQLVVQRWWDSTSPLTAKYVSSDNADVVAGTPTFVAAVQALVMSGIYRGLHEDPGEAMKMWQVGEQLAQSARTRYDQQKPKRALFNSRISMARLTPRPWPPWPGGWGGLRR